MASNEMLEEIPEEEEKSSTSVELTPYEKLLNAVHDQKLVHDIALEKRVGLYRFLGDIGRGNFSRVKKAIHLLTKDKVAIKIVDRNRLDSRNLRMLSREVATLESVQHPYILRLFEVVETLGRVHLVTEYIHGGELYYRIVQSGPFPEYKAVKIFKQIVLAVQHMHHLGYVHRDIKAENVLIISDEYVKLADFGFSTQVTNAQDYLNTFCGSPPYAAPELFSDSHYFGSPVDIWSLGILLYFILVANMPFSAPTIPQLRTTILKGEYQLPGSFSSNCIKLLQSILLHNPIHRPSIDMILRSEWVQQRAKKPESPTQNALTIIQKRKKASFWCSKSRKTSPMSPNQPIKQPEPIDCFTKKYNNIPIENFKNPLEQENSLSSAMTVVPVHNNLSTIKRNNSLINSSKVVKRIQKNEPVVEIVQNNDIIQVRSLRSYSNDDPSAFDDDEISTESEKNFERFMMLPSRTNGDANLLRTLNPIEQEVRKLMKSYGISDILLEKNIEHGPRSEIIGIYRILIMRFKSQKEQPSIINQTTVNKNNNNTLTNNNNSYKNHKSQRRKLTCAIL